MSKLSRRGFLERTLLAAAAGLAGIEVPTESAAAVPRRRAMANDAIHLAVIGVHGRGLDHIKGFAPKGDVRIVALCDVDSNVIAKAQQLAVSLGQSEPRAVQDIRKLLEDKSIDAVSIATPNHWHALAAIWSMQAGKDVYVEKPVSHEIVEGRRIVQAARKLNRICQAGTQSRSNKACQEAIQHIHSGGIGKVSLARGLCYKRRESIGIFPDSPVPSGVDYDIWQGPAPAHPFNRNRFHYNWHWNWDYGNGDVGNQGIHQMDIARWALNKSEHPKTVMGLGGRFGYVDAGQTPNTELAFFDYGDSHLIFEVRGLETSPYMKVDIGDIVYGSDGYVAFTANYGKAAAFDNNDNLVKTFTGGGDHFGNFLSAVHSRRVEDLNADILEGYMSTALCHLGNISYRLGKPVPFDENTKAFGDDKEAFATFGRFEKHLTDNGITLTDTKYFLGPTLSFDGAAEDFGTDHAANALLTRKDRHPFVVPDRV